MGPAPSLISELEDALARGSRQKRTATLRRITALFLETAPRSSTEQVAWIEGHTALRRAARRADVIGASLTAIAAEIASVVGARQ